MSEQLDVVVADVEVGSVYNGKVMKVEDKQALVNIGAKQEAILPIREVSSFHIEKVSEMLNLGDEIKVVVISTKDEEIIVSKRKAEQSEKWEQIEKAYNAGETIKGLIREVVKGGLVADVGLRAFVPASMVSNQYVEDLAEYIGQELDFLIVELDKEQNKIILSHRKVLEAQANELRKKSFNSIQVGSVVQGKVSRIASFGAFVDLGGVDGLVHVSQISYNRVQNVEEVLTVGQEVKAKVLEVNPETGRISLSLKALLQNPWDEQASQISEGQIMEGTVKRLFNFGAFVELVPNVEGLLHISQISDKKLSHAKEALAEGQKVTVKVLEIDKSSRKISLSMKRIEEDLANEEVKKYQEQAQNESGGYQIGDLFADKFKDFLK